MNRVPQTHSLTIKISLKPRSLYFFFFIHFSVEDEIEIKFLFIFYVKSRLRNASCNISGFCLCECLSLHAPWNISSSVDLLRIEKKSGRVMEIKKRQLASEVFVFSMAKVAGVNGQSKRFNLRQIMLTVRVCVWSWICVTDTHGQYKDSPVIVFNRKQNNKSVFRVTSSAKEWMAGEGKRGERGKN